MSSRGGLERVIYVSRIVDRLALIELRTQRLTAYGYRI